MGWTILSRPPREGWQAWLDRDFGKSGYKVAASAVVGDAYYAALFDPVTRSTGAVVVVIEGAGFKVLPENCGPYYYDAPAEVFDALTPTDSAWANAWRAKCRARLEARAAS